MREEQMDVAIDKQEDFSFKKCLEVFEQIINKGGPDKSDYDLLNEQWNYLYSVKISLAQENILFELFKPYLTLDSMMGLTFLKPRGYAGDFELIDKIYRNWKSPTTTIYHKWDDYYHSRAGAIAVRNRKEYLKAQLLDLNTKDDKAEVLNLACGPCSDLYEFLSTNPRSEIHFDCLDMDKEALEYSSVVCDNYYEQVNFINRNALRYKTDKKYDLIWSAGLFDYFSDKIFIRLLNRMYALLSENGEVVIGNFSPKNSARGLMEVSLQWFLHHRDEKELKNLAIQAGVDESNISIGSEETGVNLFLHLSK
jgi:SAM-dependent methyltransferase